MSEENVEIVRRIWAAADRADTKTVFGYYHPDIVWESHYGPLSGRFHGHEGVRRFFREWADSFERFPRARAETFVDAGDSVVVGHRVTGRGKGSGVEVDMAQWMIYRVENGLVVCVDLFETKADALAAVAAQQAM